MKFKNPMLVVADIDQTVEFYRKVLGLRVVMDFGANKTLTGGLCLQTLETWKEFIGTNEISFGGNNAEIYFEEADFDTFAEKLKKSTSNMSILSKSIRGDSVWFVSMTRTSISLKLEKI